MTIAFEVHVSTIAVALWAALCMLVPSVWSQSYPAKSIRLIVPYPPGGGVDAAGRIIGQALTEQLGQQVIVDNRGGATGRIGTEMVAKSPADGYTLLLGSGAPNAVIPSVTPKLPYDAIKSFAPISLVGATDYTLVVHFSLPVRTVKQLIAFARARPGQLTYGSSGILSNTHLAGELLNQLAKIDITHVAYKGTGPALMSLLTGETAVSFGGGPAAAPHVKANRLRALATTGPKRRAPDVPTISETLPGYEVTQWYGVLAPAGTPQDVLDRLHKEIVRAIANPKIAQQLANLDTDPVSNTPEAFLALIKSEMEKWAKVTQIAKIKPE
jgi:tripartite-type tricarboxylate transporter receptor subunit TctC